MNNSVNIKNLLILLIWIFVLQLFPEKTLLHKLRVNVFIYELCKNLRRMFHIWIVAKNFILSPRYFVTFFSTCNSQCNKRNSLIMCDTVHMFSRQIALNVKLGEVNLDYIYFNVDTMDVKIAHLHNVMYDVSYHLWYFFQLEYVHGWKCIKFHTH